MAMGEDRFGALLDETRRNATLGWAIVLVLCLLALGHALEGSYRWFFFTGAAVAIVLVPAAAFEDPLVMPPWELLVFVSIPVLDAAILGESVLTAVAVYLAVAAVALVVAVEFHCFTRIRMNHPFAIGLVVITTLAAAATWNVALWLSDGTLGTAYVLGGRSQDAANHAMMIDFVYATIAGLLGGVLFDRYFRIRSLSPTARTSVPLETSPEEEAEPVPSLVRGRLDAPESLVRRVSQAMQVALGGLLIYGLYARDVPTVTNGVIALAITFIPAVLERDRRLPLEPELVFWLTAAVFLHALGSAGLYALLGPFDHVTHALSASIVAAAGYSVVRAIDLHTNEVYLPPKVMFAVILLFVLAVGVVWELMEFAIDQGAQRIGFEAALAQHGIHDTILDLVFDLVGAVVAATWGSVYLTDVSHHLAGRFEG